MIRILIVEDDWAAREGLKERLRDERDLERILQRLGVHNRLMACQLAREKGWLR